MDTYKKGKVERNILLENQSQGIMFVWVLRPFNIEVIKRWHPHFLSLAKDVELGKYTVPTGNRTPDRHMAVHYATAAPRHAAPHRE